MMCKKAEYIGRTIELLLQGKRQIEISRALGISKGYVSKLVKQIPSIIRYKIKCRVPEVRI